MKSKKTIYFLLLIVIFIWGLIVYRIYSTINRSAALTMSSDVAIPEKSSSNFEYEIKANYNDPFLGKLEEGKKVYLKPKNDNQTKSLTSVPLLWPEIKYGGIIKNQQSNQQLVLVTVQGNGKIMKVDQTIGEITLNKIYRDSIEIYFKGEKKFFRK